MHKKGTDKLSFWKERTEINSDTMIFLRGDITPAWYVYVKKIPRLGMKTHVTKSLRTKDKNIAIERAERFYLDVTQSENLVSNSIFTEEDRIIATRNQGLGRIAEDKFKNLMMIRGYEVYTPVEDIWGSDFILHKSGEYMRVQLKSSALEEPMWALKNNKGVKYRDLCTHMAFMHLPSGKMWLVDNNKLPDVTSLRHGTFMNKYAKGNEIKLDVPVGQSVHYDARVLGDAL